MPHQRDHARQELNKINNNLCIQGLLNIFDRAFDFRIDHRFQTIDDFAKKISDLDQEESRLTDIGAVTRRIMAKVTSPAQEAIHEKMQVLEKIMRTVNHAVGRVSSLFNNTFVTKQSNYNSDISNLEISNTIGLTNQYNLDLHFIQKYTTRIAGNEAILFAGEEELFRCDHDQDTKGIFENLKAILEEYIIRKLDEI